MLPLSLRIMVAGPFLFLNRMTVYLGLVVVVFLTVTVIVLLVVDLLMSVVVVVLLNLSVHLPPRANARLAQMSVRVILGTDMGDQ